MSRKGSNVQLCCTILPLPNNCGYTLQLLPMLHLCAAELACLTYLRLIKVFCPLIYVCAHILELLLYLQVANG